MFASKLVLNVRSTGIELNHMYNKIDEVSSDNGYALYLIYGLIFEDFTNYDEM